MTLLENKDRQIAKKDEQIDRLLGLLETNAGISANEANKQ